MTEQPTQNSAKLSRRTRRGFVSVEWILVLTILTIGIVGGLSAVRNAILAELADICACIEAIEICEPAEAPCQGGFCTGPTP